MPDATIIKQRNAAEGRGRRPPVYRRPVILMMCLLFCAACNLTGDAPTHSPGSTPAASSDEALTVAWVYAGDLYVWRSGHTASGGQTSDHQSPRRVASGGVIQPFIAPDGQHIAFTRGPQATPESLWVVDFGGAAEQVVVSRQDLRPFQGGQPLIGQVGWLDESILYFNTLQRYDLNTEPQNDLYRANIRTREVALLLPRTEGGSFSFSPDRATIVVTYPGTYGRQDGRIRAIDPLAQQEPRNLLFFVGVATGSHEPFYADIFWEDNDTVRVAIPDADLIYNEGTPESAPVTLWRLEIAGREREILGTVPASYFGLPAWSQDGSALVYLSRVTTANRFALFTAEADGSDPAVYVEAEAGQILAPRWLAGQTRFLYAQAGALWLGIPGQPARRWLELSPAAMSQPVIAGDMLVYLRLVAGPESSSIELRYASVRDDSAGSQVIALFDTLPVYDAVSAGP